MTRTASPTALIDHAVVQPTPPRASRALLIGVLLAVLGAALGWFAYTQATAGVSAVAIARPVPYGGMIGDADLRPVTVPAGSTLRTVAWDDRRGIVGQTATTDLLADQLLSPDAVGSARLPRPGEAIVGIPSAPGQLPATGLAPRDTVLVLRLDDPAPAQRATVLAVGEPDATGKRTVDLIVPEASVAALARAAGDDRTVLVLVSAG